MSDRLSSLERLTRLRDSGVLSREEFEAEKAKILGSDATAAGQPRSSNGRIGQGGTGRRGRVAVGAVVLLLLLVLAAWLWLSPLWTLKQMQSAVRDNDADSFSKHIDFPGLRSDLKADALAEMQEKAKQSDGLPDEFAMLGAAMVGPVIDGMISPAGMRSLFAAKKRSADGLGLLETAGGDAQVTRTGLTEFEVRGSNGAVLGFSLQGLDWKLDRMEVARAKPLANAVAANTAIGERPKAALPTSFDCDGTYSNLDFSSEDGDGSGVFARIGRDGQVSMTFWEGGPSRATVTTTSRSPQRLNIQITFPDDPDQRSNGSLSCNNGKLLFRSDSLGRNDELSPVDESDAAEQEG